MKLLIPGLFFLLLLLLNTDHPHVGDPGDCIPNLLAANPDVQHGDVDV